MAELAIGVVGLAGTIDQCIKCGNALVQAYKNYQEADAKLDEMAVRIRSCWARVQSQLELTKELESTMDDEYRDLQQETLRILHNKLESAIQKLSKYDKHNKLRFAFLKNTLEAAIAELESWQRRYEPPWFHMIKRAPPTVDAKLNEIIITGSPVTAESTLVARKFRRAFKEPSARPTTGVFIRGEEIRDYNKAAIPYCTAFIATRPRDARQFIVDTTTNGAVTPNDARELARRLRDSDPFTFGIFSCKGVVRQAETPDITFLFRVPEGYTAIRSVRQLLLSGRAHDSLSDRLEMAKQLANAVYYVHLYGFVHKNIRPETILSISKTEEGGLPSMACLVGFQVIRNADGRTYPATDTTWATNLYRHPLRQGNNVDYYLMQHDIYSLGVSLLEIGLWESFIVYDSDGTAQPSTALGLAEDRSQLRSPSVLKEHLVSLSHGSMLRAKMGTKYSHVVETCLTCLDKDNLDFGDEREFQDDDGVAVGVRYIEKVLGVLNGISL